MFKVQKLLPLLTNAVSHPGKHRIPRFIYHITNKPAYESMLKDGVIKVTEDGLFGQGVFATELTNLFKRWRKNKSWDFDSLMDRLISHTAKGNDKIVILRIPTGALDTDKLVVRSQNRLFNCFSDNRPPKLEDAIKQFYREQHLHGIPSADQEKNMVETFFPTLSSHLEQGAPARYSKRYKQRKEAIEYIYSADIPMGQVEKIGEVNVAALRQTAEYDPVRPMRSIFTSLLKGTPEVKGAELLNC